MRLLLAFSEEGKQQAALEGKLCMTTSKINRKCLAARAGQQRLLSHFVMLSTRCCALRWHSGYILHLQGQALMHTERCMRLTFAAQCLICAVKVPHRTVMCRAGPHWR